MAEIPVLPGVESTFVDTERLRQHVLICGPADGLPVVFLHANLTAATHWEELMLGLASHGYRSIAPDLRGYGWSEARPADGTRGYRDFVDDLAVLVGALHIEKFHLVGWALGGAIALRYVVEHGQELQSLTLQAPLSPYGLGGTRDTRGTPCYDDFAGSGAGVVNPEFAKRIAAGDRSGDDAESPRQVINHFYYRPAFRAAREEDYLTATLQEATGSQFYPGDFIPSFNWPSVAPGVWGPINASSPKYVANDAQAFVRAAHKPPVLWVRGKDDRVVSDGSLFDPGMLGQLGQLSGWPGQDVYPPQPMIGQTRAVLDEYASAGGTYREVVLENCGHSPHIEYPDRWIEAFVSQTKSDRLAGWLVM